MLTLRYQFLYHYNSLSYVDELFDMIEADKLRKWIVGQFLRDFNVSELKQMFNYEEIRS